MVGGRAFRSVADERPCPSHDQEIVRVVRESRIQHFSPFFVRQRNCFATNDLRDLRAEPGN